MVFVCPESFISDSYINHALMKVKASHSCDIFAPFMKQTTVLNLYGKLSLKKSAPPICIRISIHLGEIICSFETPYLYLITFLLYF